MREPSLRLLEDAGMKALCDDDRKLIVSTSRPGVRVLLARAMDIPLFVARGAADFGIAGDDAVAECGLYTSSCKWVRDRDLAVLMELNFGACKVALAAPPRVSEPQSIATTMPNIASRYCRSAKIIRLQGALETAPMFGIAEAIVDQVDTGTTLRENGLRILKVLMESRIRLFANPASLKTKKAELDRITLCLGAVIEARKRLMVRVNAATDLVRDTLVKLRPAMKSPDVSPIVGGGYALTAAVPKKDIEDLVVALKGSGGSDIVVTEPRLIVL
jgi:ATP phosphoribosyltransferase